MALNVKALGKKRPVTIVGAGFSGLTAAFYLSRAGFQVEVIEEQTRVGGLIGTHRAPFGLIETAANGLLNSARVEELFKFMGLELTPTLKDARKRFIFRNGWARRWPVGISATLRLVWFLIRYFIVRKTVAPRREESVRRWAERTLGRENTQYLVEAALQGIYAGDPGRMSASLVFGSMFQRLRRRERLPKAKLSGTVCAPDGMGELITRLRERLESHGVRFLMNQKMAPLERTPLHPYVIATSAEAARPLIEKVDVARARALESVELLPIVTATVCFREAPPEARGFGCLFPPTERRKALGVLMNNFIFPHRVTKGASETWIFGGARAERAELEALSDQDFVNIAAEERQATLNATGEVLGAYVTRWPKALPHYTLELERVVPELNGLRQNIVLTGNYLGQIGLTKILERAARLPEEIAAKGEWPASGSAASSN